MQVLKDIKSKEPVFEPIYIKLETQEEVDKLFTIINYAPIARFIEPDHTTWWAKLQEFATKNYARQSYLFTCLKTNLYTKENSDSEEEEKPAKAKKRSRGRPYYEYRNDDFF